MNHSTICTLIYISYMRNLGNKKCSVSPSRVALYVTQASKVILVRPWHELCKGKVDIHPLSLKVKLKLPVREEITLSEIYYTF